LIAGTKIQTINYDENCTQVMAVPAANCHFTGWAGDFTGYENPLTLTNITKNISVSANFAHNTATLTVNKNGNGTAGFSLVNPVNTVTAIPITATPYANNHFVNWTVSEGSAIIANPKSAVTTVKLTGDHESSVTITANFAENIAPTTLPPAPRVFATGGTYEDRVVISWKAVPGATSYKIYRNTLNSTIGITDPIGETTDCIFEDSSAEYDITYFYFAKAVNAIGDSLKFSVGNSGYVSKTPVVPGSVTASDGTYFDKIRVSWARVTGATSYRVFCTETATPAPDPKLDTDLVGETTALFLDDFGDKIVPPPGDVTKKYYYWIAAKNRNSMTAISRPNYGYLSKKGPTTVTASNGTYSNKIVVTWTEVPGATAYDIYRYTDAKFSQTDNTFGTAGIGTTKGAILTYEDSSGSVDTPYYYKVKAKYGSGDPADPDYYKYDSDFSLRGAVGKASTGALNLPATAIVNGATSANQSGTKGSFQYFSTEVPVGTTRLVATLDGTNNLSSNDCDLRAKFANFPTITSYNARGIENKVNEILSVTNPAAGTWYFLLYGVTAYADVTLTVNCYSVTDIVLTQIPVNDLAVPFTAVFKGKVIDEIETGIPNIVLQVRNPITGQTTSLRKTDAKGCFSYSALFSAEGEHTFDFFFTEMPDTAKGTASHTVATRKGCLEENNYFDFSAYLPAAPVAVPLQSDIMGLQTFLDIRNGWNITDTVTPGDSYETLWINSTIVKAGDDAQLTAKLDVGLYMFFYGVEGAGAGNDTSANSALSAVPFVVHVEATKRDIVAGNLNTLGIIGDTQKTAILAGNIGIVAVASLSSPDESTDGYDISILAREQLEILAKLASGSGATDITDVKYSDVTAKQITITLDNSRKINVVAAAFVK
jgi:hypothetical protein